MIIRGTNLSMIRGDSESITLIQKDIDGAQVDFVEGEGGLPGDKVYFTVKENVNSDKKALQIVVDRFDETDGVAIIPIPPEATKHLEFRRYVYDIQISYKNGTVTTVVPPSEFNVLGEVTYE